MMTDRGRETLFVYLIFLSFAYKFYSCQSGKLNSCSFYIRISKQSSDFAKNRQSYNTTSVASPEENRKTWLERDAVNASCARLFRASI